MAPYEALYGRPCRSPTCWLEAGESSLFGPEIVRETIEKIQLIREVSIGCNAGRKLGRYRSPRWGNI